MKILGKATGRVSIEYASASRCALPGPHWLVPGQEVISQCSLSWGSHRVNCLTFWFSLDQELKYNWSLDTTFKEEKIRGSKKSVENIFFFFFKEQSCVITHGELLSCLIHWESSPHRGRAPSSSFYSRSFRFSCGVFPFPSGADSKELSASFSSLLPVLHSLGGKVHRSWLGRCLGNIVTEALLKVFTGRVARWKTLRWVHLACNNRLRELLKWVGGQPGGHHVLIYFLKFMWWWCSFPEWVLCCWKFGVGVGNFRDTSCVIS